MRSSSYAGSTVRAAELFHDMAPDAPLTVLVDYFGQEITDALAVANNSRTGGCRQAVDPT